MVPDRTYDPAADGNVIVMVTVADPPAEIVIGSAGETPAKVKGPSTVIAEMLCVRNAALLVIVRVYVRLSPTDPEYVVEKVCGVGPK